MTVGMVRSVLAASREHGVSLVSAGIAFHMFNMLLTSLVFLIIAMTIVGWVEILLIAVEPLLWDDRDTILSTMEGLIGEGTGRRRAAGLAGVILIWSAFTMFQSMNIAIGHVYGSRSERSGVGAIVDTVLILATVIVAVGIMILVHVGLTLLIGTTAATIVSVPLVAIILFATFVPMISQFSPPHVTPREVLPGAVLTAVAWTACAVGFRLYVTFSESVELYGIAGGILLLLTALYIAALALLVGVVLNAVRAGKVAVPDH